MLKIIDVCLSKEEYAVTVECEGGVVNASGVSMCNLSSVKRLPYYLIDISEEIDGVEVKRGYAICWGRTVKGKIELNVLASDIKNLLDKGFTSLNWIFSFLNNLKDARDRIVVLENPGLLEEEGYLNLGEMGQFKTRKVKRYFDEKGKMKNEYTCFVFYPHYNDEDKINREFAYLGKTVVDESGNEIPLKVIGKAEQNLDEGKKL
jgi:hypothetical protein